MTIINPDDYIEDLGCFTQSCMVIFNDKVTTDVLSCDRELGWIIQLDGITKRCHCGKEFMRTMRFGKVELKRKP